MKTKTYDPVERAKEKQESRERDEAALAERFASSGEKTQEQLRKENGYFSQLKYIINFSKAKSLY